MDNRDEQIRAAAKALGLQFPDDYVEWLRRNDGIEGEFGECYLSLYDLAQVLELNRAHDLKSFMPGFLLVGSDGGGEGIGFDLRDAPPSVVMVNLNSARWVEAIPQAHSFEGFMEQRRLGLPLRWA